MSGAYPIDPSSTIPPRNRRERRAMKAARATDMRAVKLHDAPARRV